MSRYDSYGMIESIASLAVLSVLAGGKLPLKDPTCVYRSFCGPIQPTSRQQMRAAMRQAAKAVNGLRSSPK